MLFYDFCYDFIDVYLNEFWLIYFDSKNNNLIWAWHKKIALSLLLSKLSKEWVEENTDYTT